MEPTSQSILKAKAWVPNPEVVCELRKPCNPRPAIEFEHGLDLAQEARGSFLTP